MAKTLTIKDPVSKKVYTLEYTRKTVAQMERNGFIAEDVTRKPMSLLPAMFAGAFQAHHRGLEQKVIDGLYDRMGSKTELIGKLVEMYNEPILALMTDPDEQAGTEGNVDWTADW